MRAKCPGGLHHRGPERLDRTLRVSYGFGRWVYAALGHAYGRDQHAGQTASDRYNQRDVARGHHLWDGRREGGQFVEAAQGAGGGLWQVRETRPTEEIKAFVSQLRVYSISDQVNAGPRRRREFPDLFYIVSPSTPDSKQYGSATWTGVSGDKCCRNAAGADFTMVSDCLFSALAHFP